MREDQIHTQIEQLVSEEQELWRREAQGEVADDDRRRLEELKVNLDQCCGTCCGSGVPSVTPASTRTPPTYGTPTSSSIIGSSASKALELDVDGRSPSRPEHPQIMGRRIAAVDPPGKPQPHTAVVDDEALLHRQADLQREAREVVERLGWSTSSVGRGESCRSAAR